MFHCFPMYLLVMIVKITPKGNRFFNIRLHYEILINLADFMTTKIKKMSPDRFIFYFYILGWRIYRYG